MNFKKYTSIENSYRQEIIDKIVKEGHDQCTWYVTEKIHGANFSFWCDGVTVRVAGRNGFLGEDGAGHYSSKYLFDKYKDKVMNMFHGMRSLMSVNSIVIYGEMFGGDYLHKEVKRQDFAKVQKGVYYCPHVDFIAFDLIVNGMTRGFDSFHSLTNHEIMCVTPLSYGSLEKCLSYPNSFITTIPQRFGLPEINNNFCEGVVLQPMKPKHLTCGSRVILKNKNEAFKEKTKRSTKNRPTIEYTEDVSSLCDEILRYCNLNRFNNLKSKMGVISSQDIGPAIKALNEDTLEDFMKDNYDKFNELDKKYQKVITKTMTKANSELIVKNR